MQLSSEAVRSLLCELGDHVRSLVIGARGMDMSVVEGVSAADTIYAIDRVSEETLLHGLAEVARTEPMWVIAEGLPSGGVGLPHGVTDAECRWRVLVDPIDGTRGLMYQKRPAWILTGVAPNRGAAFSRRSRV